MSQAQRILVKARRQVFSELIGNNPSIFQGEGYDFIELREYMPGDDIRRIDWNVTAKMRTPYIKIFKEERELSVVMGMMLNGSVHFGQHRFKQDVMAEIAAITGYAVQYNNDALGYMLFADRLYDEGRPTKNRHAVSELTRRVDAFDVLGKRADYKRMGDTLYQRIRRRSLLVIVGDFFEIPQWRLLAKKHEVVCIIVRDRLEESPPPFGFASLRDPETSQLLEGDFSTKAVRKYEAKVRAHDHALFERLRKDGIRFTKIYTDDHVGVKLRRLFQGA
ncbi:MAG TPA: DUF58 domain-containing protein [Sulfuricurvum sp.]|nr:DUF58 domain-containing protein [Sulfuricurvum sp.]